MRKPLQITVVSSITLGLMLLALVGPGGAENEKKVSKEPPPANPGHKNYVETIKGEDGTEANFEMVAIRGGTFMMGSPENEPGRQPDEGPQHPVTVRPFWMGKCEVTWDEFDIYWLTEPDALVNPDAQPKKLADAVTRPTPPYVDETYGHDREGHPALCMTHHTAMKYCEWLSALTGKIYRLPTEAEWEYACRAGSTGPYCFGDDASKLGDHAWYKENSPDEFHPVGTTHPVGTKKPNAFGLHDMHGNVMEWCLDHYEKDYYSKFDPKMPALWPVLIPTEAKWSHVARGGHWKSPPEELRCAARIASDQSWMKHDPQIPQSIWWLTRFDTIGFRVIRPYEEQENLIGLKSKVVKGVSECGSFE